MEQEREDYAEGEPPVSSELVRTLVLIVGLTLLIAFLIGFGCVLWPGPYD